MMVLLAMTGTIKAVPAKSGAVKVQQPDGSYVSIVLRGDEWLNFNTTTDGYSVVKNSQGFYVYAEKQDGQLKATQMVAHDAQQRQAAEVDFLTGVEKYLRPEMTAEMAQKKQQVEAKEAAKRAANMSQSSNGRRAAQYDYNNFRGLVILIEYNDKSFSRSDYASIANDMMNKENYTGFSGNLFTGSVRDYFSDCSLGKFKPQFDVYGPIKVDKSQYDVNQTYYAEDILKAAIDNADSEINFKDYDRDNDGYVDMIYFIVAGYGSNYSGNDSRLWWPHRSSLYWKYITKDGVRMGDYASSVEMYGWTSQGTNIIDGIGTICHEFSHVLGLPDFYDTDYSGSGGQSNDPGLWSVMSGGSYENYGRTPVGYSLYERWATGFCDAPEVVVKGNEYTLNPLYQEMQGYKIKTPNNNEYFLLENRQKNQFKWDAYLPGSGMLVHRVEGEGNSAWNGNTINANPKHNYYEVVRANGDNAKNQYDVFPSLGKTELSNNSSPATLLTWSGKYNELALVDIKMTNGIITFKATGYEVSALAITPNEIPDLGVGLTQQLSCEITPISAETTLTWYSDKPEIASVDENGLVKGLAPGTCTITVMSSNQVEASCQVTVKEMVPYSIQEFKQETLDKKVVLKLTDAQVLFAYKKNNATTAYLRDATGCIMLTDAKVDLKTNDIVNGTIFVKTGMTNKVPQAIGIEGTTGDALTITAGAAAQPREVTIDGLTEADYCDLVVVKSTPLERVTSGSSKYIWAYGENNRARIWAGNFSIKSNVPSTSLTDLLFDVTAVYATNVLNGEIINELNVVKAVEQVENPTGITAAHLSHVATHPYYNLNGQRVGKGYKGLVIVNGKKLMKK